MSDSPRFVEGKIYRYEEIAPYTFPAKGSVGIRTPGMLFRYCRDPEIDTGYFDEVVEPENPLVDSMVAQKAIEDLRSKGFSFRQISRMAGVSVEAVHRSSGGVGRIRSSTEEALLRVSASLSNGNLAAIHEPSRCSEGN